MHHTEKSGRPFHGGRESRSCVLLGFSRPTAKRTDGEASVLAQETGTGVAMTTERVPMTKEQYEKLKGDIDRLEQDMTEITKRVATARAMGDLSENAEYHAAREDQGLQQRRILLARDRLARAVIIDPSELPQDTVVFGARVRVKDLDSGEVEDLELVGPGDEDYENNKILTTSPRGRGLLGKKVGEVAEITVPRGTLRYEIIEIGASC